MELAHYPRSPQLFKYVMEFGPAIATSGESFHEKATNGMTARLLCSVLHSGLAFGRIIATTGDGHSKQIIESFTEVSPKLSKFKFFCIVAKENHELSDPVLIVPLRELPFHDSKKTVVMIEPEELDFPIFHLQDGTWNPLQSPASTIINLLLNWHPQFDPARAHQIIQELENCVEHQAYAYSLQGTKILPRLGDHSMLWEHSLTEGHPTHPMHKCRFPVPPMREIRVNADLLHPIINYVAAPKKDFSTFGSFESIMEPVRKLLITQHNPLEEFIIPVHSYQISSLLSVFPTARILQYEERAEACLNLRTVQITSLRGFHVKLSVGLVLGGGTRTFGEYSCRLCEVFEDIVSRVVEDKYLLLVARDIGSAILKHPDPNVSRQLSCVIREDPEYLCRARGEALVVCAALIESDQDSEYVVNKILNLDTVEKRWSFLQTYIRLFLKAMVPPLYKYGFCFEAHAQNTLARFQKLENSDGFQLVGFLVRDYNGFKYHLQTLERTTGIQVKVKHPSKSVSIEKLHAHGFHSLIQVHLLRIIRALGFHYSGAGLKFLKTALDELLPDSCSTRELWLKNETLCLSAFITMKLEGKHSECVFREIPNFLLRADVKNFKFDD